jgi:hypothetical protein
VKPEKTEVTCYSGYTYAERPVSFLWRDKKYEIEEIEKRWLEPGKRLFRVRTVDNKSFQLCYNETEQHWLLTEPDGD